MLNMQLFFFVRCEITSREYCDFMKGYFHEEATLCSQVSKFLRRLRKVFRQDLIQTGYFLSSYRCTAWMMSVDCCLSSTLRSPISSTGSGSHCSCMLGESQAHKKVFVCKVCGEIY